MQNVDTGHRKSVTRTKWTCKTWTYKIMQCGQRHKKRGHRKNIIRTKAAMKTRVGTKNIMWTKADTQNVDAETV